MKRKAALLALSLCFIGMTSGCGGNGENAAYITTTAETELQTTETSTITETSPQITENTVTETEPQTAETTTVTETGTQTEADTAVSETVRELAETEKIPVEVLFTYKDIYLYSFWCDYLPQDKKPPTNGKILLIENDEQLAFAEDRYGLAVPEDLPKSDEWWYNKSVADAFQDMKSNYPLDKYSYAVCYDETHCGGYYLHADRLVKIFDELYFGMDGESYSPSEDEEYPAVEGGFCHMAALTKCTFGNSEFTNVIFPDKNDPKQDIDYGYSIVYDAGTEELYNEVGGDVIYISSREEYEDFLKKYEKYLYTDRLLPADTDFEKVTAAICFYVEEYKYPYINFNSITVSDGTVNIDYTQGTVNLSEKLTQPVTCMIYVTVPKRFLRKSAA